MALRGRSLIEPCKPVWRKFAQTEREGYARQIGAGGGGGGPPPPLASPRLRAWTGPWASCPSWRTCCTWTATPTPTTGGGP